MSWKKKKNKHVKSRNETSAKIYILMNWSDSRIHHEYFSLHLSDRRIPCSQRKLKDDGFERLRNVDETFRQSGAICRTYRNIFENMKFTTFSQWMFGWTMWKLRRMTVKLTRFSEINYPKDLLRCRSDSFFLVAIRDEVDILDERYDKEMKKKVCLNFYPMRWNSYWIYFIGHSTCSSSLCRVLQVLQNSSKNNERLYEW